MKVEIIAVPFDSGQRVRRMGRGPDRLLERGLVDRLRALGAEVRVHHVEPDVDSFHAEIGVAFELQRLVATCVAEARRAGSFPLVLSGNCNMAGVGAVAGLQAAGGRAPIVCWFDAHADFNTPESTVGGFLDGMAMAMVTGRCWQEMTKRVPGFRAVPESNVVLVGTRDLDPLERELLSRSDVCVLALHSTIGETVAAMASSAGTRESYLHVDLDVLDPAEGRVNRFSAAGGLSRSSLLAALRDLQEVSVHGAAALTAYDPAFDDDGRVARVALDVAEQIVRGAMVADRAAYGGAA